MSYNADNYEQQGGAVWVVGGELQISSGATITAAGSQAANIAAVTTGTGASASGNATAINAIITALEGVGILATS
ncbi:MAG TPA: hypothetical protein VIG24_05040 [Acidimicrobiia bacterium]